MPDGIGFLFWQVGLAQEGWSGTQQNDAEIGGAAMESLVASLRRGEKGTPPVRRRVLVESSPVSGQTVRGAAVTLP